MFKSFCGHRKNSDFVSFDAEGLRLRRFNANLSGPPDLGHKPVFLLKTVPIGDADGSAALGADTVDAPAATGIGNVGDFRAIG